MKIKSISFLNGWQGSSSIRIKAVIEYPDELAAGKPMIESEVIIEKEEAERILIDRLSDGCEIKLLPAQKLYRIFAAPKDERQVVRIN